VRALALIVLVGCGDNVTDKLAACRLAQAQGAATVQDRKAIGEAAPYVPDLGLAARDGELQQSIAARRQAAWQVVAKVVAPVPLADLPGTVPAWATWYARDDFERVFEHLYRALTPAERHARAPIDAAAGLAWNPTALDGLADWPEQRYLDYLASIQTQDQLQGIGGINRVGYSPGAMAHLITSYARQDACRLAEDPSPYAEQPVRAGAPVAAAERVAVGACEWRVLGPYAAGDAPVAVTTAGDGDADVYVRRGAPPDEDHYDCRSDGDDSGEHCTVDGGAPVYVGVFGARESAVDVRIEYLAQDVADPACLAGEMPRDAVLVKADWQRVLGDPLATFDTSGDRMHARLAGAATWTPDGTADPGDASIYTVQTATTQVFRLPALHIMSKELDHWMWITLWWSPDPDSDFGADRPAGLPGVWRNYKMCVSSSYLEGDPDPRGGQGGSLGDALSAVHGGAGEPTWCSNPYLELGAGNAATNCIGCHQHGGTALLPDEILAGAHHGTTRVRNNFFTDYLWAIKGGRGEELSAIVQAELDYWDATDPR